MLLQVNSDSSDRSDHINTESVKITIASVFIFSMKKHAFEKIYQVCRGNLRQIYTQTNKK